MQAFMEPDQLCRVPAGVGHQPKPEPVPTVESVMADIARLSVEARMTVRLKLNMAAYGFAPVPEHIVALVNDAIYGEAPGT